MERLDRMDEKTLGFEEKLALLLGEARKKKNVLENREVLDFLKELNEEGNTIVIITHDSSIALEAKRVVRIHDGKINFDGDVNEYAAIL